MQTPVGGWGRRGAPHGEGLRHLSRRLDLRCGGRARGRGRVGVRRGGRGIGRSRQGANQGARRAKEGLREGLARVRACLRRHHLVGFGHRRPWRRPRRRRRGSGVLTRLAEEFCERLDGDLGRRARTSTELEIAPKSACRLCGLALRAGLWPCLLRPCLLRPCLLRPCTEAGSEAGARPRGRPRGEGGGRRTAVALR